MLLVARCCCNTAESWQRLRGRRTKRSLWQRNLNAFGWGVPAYFSIHVLISAIKCTAEHWESHHTIMRVHQSHSLPVSQNFIWSWDHFVGFGFGSPSRRPVLQYHSLPELLLGRCFTQFKLLCRDIWLQMSIFFLAFIFNYSQNRKLTIKEIILSSMFLWFHKSFCRDI